MRVHRLLETLLVALECQRHSRMSSSPPVYSHPSPTTSQSSDTSQYLIQHTHAGKPKDRGACPPPHTPPPIHSPHNSFSTAPPTRRTSCMSAPLIFLPHPRSLLHCNIGTGLSGWLLSRGSIRGKISFVEVDFHLLAGSGSKLIRLVVIAEDAIDHGAGF
jgi:hypothetical protein